MVLLLGLHGLSGSPRRVKSCGSGLGLLPAAHEAAEDTAPGLLLFGTLALADHTLHSSGDLLLDVFAVTGRLRLGCGPLRRGLGRRLRSGLGRLGRLLRLGRRLCRRGLGGSRLLLGSGLLRRGGGLSLLRCGGGGNLLPGRLLLLLAVRTADPNQAEKLLHRLAHVLLVVCHAIPSNLPVRILVCPTSGHARVSENNG